MSGLLDEIQLARCRLPWGRGNRRVGSEVDKELRFDDIVLGPGVADVVGRGKGLEVRRWGAGVSEKVEDDADGEGEVGVTKCGLNAVWKYRCSRLLRVREVQCWRRRID